MQTPAFVWHDRVLVTETRCFGLTRVQSPLSSAAVKSRASADTVSMRASWRSALAAPLCGVCWFETREHKNAETPRSRAHSRQAVRVHRLHHQSQQVLALRSAEQRRRRQRCSRSTNRARCVVVHLGSLRRSIAHYERRMRRRVVNVAPFTQHTIE